MKHVKEEELIAYRQGIAEQRAVISEHLAACKECRGELERIETVLIREQIMGGGCGGKLHRV